MHAHNGAHKRQERARFQSTVYFFWIANVIPQKLRIMCSKWAQHIFLNPVPACRRHRCLCAHRLITGLLPEQHWMVAADRRVRSEGGQNPGGFLTAHGLEWSSICFPINGWQPPNKPILKTFSSTFDAGVLLRFFIFFNQPRSKSRHHAGANCGLTLLKWLARCWRVSLCHASPALSDAILLCVIPASGLPTYWACCVIRSSWGSSKQAGAMRSYVVQGIVRNLCWSLWVLRTPAPGFHLERCAAGLQRTGCRLHIWTAWILSSAACSVCALPAELVCFKGELTDIASDVVVLGQGGELFAWDFLTLSVIHWEHRYPKLDWLTTRGKNACQAMDFA